MNATACLQNAPSPDRGAGDGTAFSLTATERPRDGGTVAAVWSFDIRAPRPGSVCNSASIIRDAIAPRNNPTRRYNEGY